MTWILRAASAALLLTWAAPAVQAQPAAQASADEDAPWTPQGVYALGHHAKLPAWRPSEPGQLLGQSLIASGQAMEALKQPEAAAVAYVSAAAFLPELTTLLHVEAARVLVDEPGPAALAALKRVMAHPQASSPLEGAGLIQARAAHRLQPHGELPALAMAQGALERGPVEPACAWLLGVINPQALPWAKLTASDDQDTRARRAQLMNLAHGSCLGPQARSPAAPGAPLTPLARQQRAQLLHHKVRFLLAKAEIEALGDLEQLPTADERCQMTLLLGRTLFRIRKERDKALALYGLAAQRCQGPALDATRRSALYAAGKQAYETAKRDEATRRFEALLEGLKPSDRYADDALYYLAKLARDAKQPDKELALVKRALKDHPSGDMIFELVWEHLEGRYRAKKYAEFLKALDQLTLPEHDDNYMSQGRLEHLRAMAHLALKQRKAAIQSLQAAWTRYPMSFYGALSWVRLKQLGAAPTMPAQPEALSAEALFDEGWASSAGALLAQLGLWSWAAQAERERQRRQVQPMDATAQWRLALLYDRAARHEISHNLARRQIPGSPWALPEDAQRPWRWLIAWPNPFGQLIHQAVLAEAKQHDKVWLHQALPLAIMREESSFIPEIESYAGALGLMQLMPRTALAHDEDVEGRATPEQLKKPQINIRVGVDHLFALSRAWGGHPALIAASYNAGSGGLSRWLDKATTQDVALFIEEIPSFQTRNYTKRVIGSYAAYQWLLGERTLDMRLGDPVKKR